MSWFTNIFSSGVSDVVKSVGDVIDNITTSDEEREQLKNALQKEMNTFKKEQLSHAETMEQEITKRQKNDMQSDSWLSKNVRPMVIIFLTSATVLLAYLTVFSDLTEMQVSSLQGWIPLLQNLLLGAYSFYFGGRTIEKFKKMGKDKKSSEK